MPVLLALNYKGHFIPTTRFSAFQEAAGYVCMEGLLIHIPGLACPIHFHQPICCCLLKSFPFLPYIISTERHHVVVVS